MLLLFLFTSDKAGSCVWITALWWNPCLRQTDGSRTVSWTERSSYPGLVAIAEILLVGIHCRKELPGNASVRWSLREFPCHFIRLRLSLPFYKTSLLPAILYDFTSLFHSTRLHFSQPFYTTSLLPPIFYDFTSPCHSLLHFYLPFYRTSLLPAILFDLTSPCHSVRLHFSLQFIWLQFSQPFYTTSLLPTILYDFTSPTHFLRLRLSLPFFTTWLLPAIL